GYGRHWRGTRRTKCLPGWGWAPWDSILGPSRLAGNASLPGRRSSRKLVYTSDTHPSYWSMLIASPKEALGMFNSAKVGWLLAICSAVIVSSCGNGISPDIDTAQGAGGP